MKTEAETIIEQYDGLAEKVKHDSKLDDAHEFPKDELFKNVDVLEMDRSDAIKTLSVRYPKLRHPIGTMTLRRNIEDAFSGSSGALPPDWGKKGRMAGDVGAHGSLGGKHVKRDWKRKSK
jgi:hypothetical protein